MGAGCGSARDSSQPGENDSGNKRSNNRKLTSLDDIINVKQRKSA